MTRKEAPATVYVVTSQDIKDSGAQTIWDALRGVPGVDVVQTRTNQGEISIRGLDKPLNNRTLVLVNGRTELNPFFDFITWESIPFTMDEIDRIEVVEGPASAIYGANAVNGVINIITKTPEQSLGVRTSLTAGSYNTHIADFDYGRKLDKWAYRFGGGYRAMDRFEDSDNLASRSGKFNLSTEYTPDSDRKLSVSGGLTRLNTEVTSGSAGTFFNKGSESFFETVYRNRGTKYRAYWNRYRTELKNFTALNEGRLDSDIYYGEIEQSLSLPSGNEALIGGSVQRNSSRSTVLPKAQIQQLWALYLEDKWEISDQWSMLASGRLDGHPYTPIMLSPRASLIFSPVQEQVFRLSAGTAFRNPTLLENNINTVLETPLNDPLLPFFTSVQTTTLGNRNLKSERIKTAELAHTGQFGSLTTRLAGFYYKLRKIITSSPSQTTGLVPPTMT
ncbi:MAG: TonB-dependent receptor, partial [Elusimicrobiaceae bacterium]